MCFFIDGPLAINGTAAWIKSSIQPYPFPNKDNITVFKKEKANIERYSNIGAYVRLIEDFESDLYKSAVVPIALAQKYTAISLQPGGKVLDILAQSAVSQ